MKHMWSEEEIQELISEQGGSGGGGVHLYEHKLYIMAYDNLYCNIHPIYLSTNTAITKDNVPINLIGYNYSNDASNICLVSRPNRIEIENHGSNLIESVTDTVTQIF